MKIPLIRYHIVSEQVLIERKQAEEKLDALRWLTSDCIPDLEQLGITLREAKVGAEAYGRRMKRRKIFREVSKFKARITA